MESVLRPGKVEDLGPGESGSDTSDNESGPPNRPRPAPASEADLIASRQKPTDRGPLGREGEEMAWGGRGQSSSSLTFSA